MRVTVAFTSMFPSMDPILAIVTRSSNLQESVTRKLYKRARKNLQAQTISKVKGTSCFGRRVKRVSQVGSRRGAPVDLAGTSSAQRWQTLFSDSLLTFIPAVKI